MKANKDAVKNETLSQSRWLITAQQMSKLAKGNNPVFLAIVRETNEAPQMKKTNKRSFVCAVRIMFLNLAHVPMSPRARTSVLEFVVLKQRH